MKKSELPQDKGHLENFTREVCYVKNAEGKYEADLSVGWEVKNDALDNAWSDIDERIEQSKKSFLDGTSSQVAYFMERELMDIGVLSGYTGFWKWQIKRHMKSAVFNKLSDKKLSKYAEAFGVSIQELKKPNL
jgi:hypothetical protein|tara:strand:+ start:26 stop:424 length:399 start_codon:yes stop_codon:yes gene_type:complete